jgi:hypothetical protein
LNAQNVNGSAMDDGINSLVSYFCKTRQREDRVMRGCCCCLAFVRNPTNCRCPNPVTYR